MYESFYGFRANPFTLIPDPRFLYLGTQHKTALNLLEYGLFNRAIFTVITGEPGTGKTTLLNAILEQSQHEVTLGVLSHTHAGLGSLMPWVLMAFGLDGKGMDSVELFKAFSAFISREHERQRRLILVVDEAQNLEPTTLKTILTRIGEGTKVVFTGDTSQIDAPYMGESNNALAVLIRAFAGQPCFGHITLVACERSEVASLAAELL